MPTFSYILSSVLFLSPFVIPGIIVGSYSDEDVDEKKSYGELFALVLMIVSSIVLWRIALKEITFSDLVNGSKLLRFGKKGVSTESGSGLGNILKKLINFPGYIFSMLLFPTNNLNFYIGYLTFLIMTGVFVVRFINGLGTESLTQDNKNLISTAIIISVICLSLIFRFYSDKNRDEEVYLSNKLDYDIYGEYGKVLNDESKKARSSDLRDYTRDNRFLAEVLGYQNPAEAAVAGNINPDGTITETGFGILKDTNHATTVPRFQGKNWENTAREYLENLDDNLI